MEIQFIVCIFVSASIGIVLGYLWGKLKYQADSGISRSEFETIREDRISLIAKNEEIFRQRQTIEQELKEERDKARFSEKNLNIISTEFKNLKEKFELQKSEFEEMQKKLTKEFENIANQVIINNSKSFNAQTTENLKSILEPFGKNISEFEKKIDETREKQIAETTSLKSQIESLQNLNKTMSEETKNLTTALKGESKTRGNWGEVLLERILEISGLVKGTNYTTQETYRNEENKSARPDVVIELPDNKHIIVDSKLSLIAYERYVNSDLPEEKEKFLREHLSSVTNHIKELSSKEYQNLKGLNSPDFVLMFIPIESALDILIQDDHEFYNRAIEKNILPVTATSLLASLKMIANIWRQENQNRNAMSIAREGGKLYDKFVSFLEDLKAIGKSISSSQKSYDDALNKLSEGRGNLVGQAEKLKTLGAKVSKSIPSDMLSVEDE
ncbi:MAG: DNA recombination protein RmuC [Leptospira sp.]|nr:DNA recombination protein RmuC [Leptospira sp.]